MISGIFNIKTTLFFCLLLFPLFLYPEGTRQLMPASVSKGQLCINKSRNDFAFYDGAAEFRLNISIADPSETIRFGFGKVIGTYATDLVFRIKNQSGSIVYGPFPVPASGNGFISTYAEAVSGPFPAAGGYNYLGFQPAASGDYYLEFYYPPLANGVYDESTRHMLTFFDITVVNTAGNAVNGRVWSKAWQFWSEDPGDTGNRFYGKMMILSDDSIVTQVDCNGYRGGSFSFSSNMTGCATTGDLAIDRKSKQGFHTYPQYKVFLNDPDSVLYPTEKLTSGIIQPVIVNTDCKTGGVEFDVKVVKDGSVKLLIELNPAPGADPEDVLLIASVKANPGGTGYNIITWDGKDNNGNPVSNGTSLVLSETFISGLTHLPIYDIENNDYGFIVQQIRPKGGQLKIYWDDTNISGGTYNISTGCNSSGGCHTWSNDFGNERTINSWWYVTRSVLSSIPILTKKMPGELTITSNGFYCMGTGNKVVSLSPEPNSTSYVWSYSGTGVTIVGTDATTTLNFEVDATPGVLSVFGHNDACGEGPVSQMNIIFDTIPDVVLTDFPDICYTAEGFILSGGQPAGGLYYVDGILSDSLVPFKEASGMHKIIYTFITPGGCTNSDTAGIYLYKAPECEGVVMLPNAFSPNRDGLNEEFRPLVKNISTFEMSVFNKWGQLLFSTHDASQGWNGKFRGEACSSGIYTYILTYGVSLRISDKKTKKGVFALIR